MHLDKIEINNFKSYRGSYAIGPFDRFTCIVGPNGSGKSNILDAVSFVLNVPNNCLRARQLKNLISYGEYEASVRVYISGRIFERRLSRNRSEASKDARLDAKFEDDSVLNDTPIDFTSSTVCKYLVDGNRISQKQYNHELEILNILNKTKNFVIYQGDIIKSGIDLLKIVESACGSDVYIEEYNTLSEKLGIQNKELSLKHERRKDCLELLKEMSEVKEKEKNFKILIDKKEAIQRALYEAQIKSKKNEVQRLKNALNSLESMRNEDIYNEHLSIVNRIRGEAARLQKEYFEKESELLYLKSKDVKTSKNDQEERQEELRKLDEKLRRSQEDLSRFKQSLNINKEEFEMQLNIKEKEYSIQIAHLEKQLSEITLLNFDKINKRDVIQSTLRQMGSKAAKIKARNVEIERDNKDKQARVYSIDKEIESLRNKIQNRISSYETIISDEERLNKELNSVMKEILLNKAKKNDLTKRSLIKNVIGNLKNIFSGVYGRVIDLIEPTQKKYELAVGVLLSKYDQAVVVENEKVAMDCLRYIKETKSCKLTFLPISRIKARSNEDDSENIPNALKQSNAWKDQLSRNCISFNQSYEKIVDFILGNSLIVESVEKAKHILYSNDYPGKICTLDGTLFSPNGLISGGNILTNKFEDDLIESLLNKRKVILGDIKVNRDRKDAFSDVGIIKEKIDELLIRKSNIRFEKIETILLDDMNFSALQSELNSLEESLKEFEAQKRGIKESKKQIEKNILFPLLSTIGMSSLSEYKERVREDIRKQEIGIDIEGMKNSIALLKEELSNSKSSKNETVSAEDISVLECSLNKLYTMLETTKEKLRIEGNALRLISERRGELNAAILSHQLHRTRIEEELKDIVKYAILESGYKEDLDLESLSLSERQVSNHPDEFGNGSIDSLKAQLDSVNQQINENVPTVSSSDTSIQNRYSKFNREYEIAKEAAMTTKNKFMEVERRRLDAFSQCFSKISSEIPKIYQNLTKTVNSTESKAYLIYEGDPFSNNLKYYLMPPSKGLTEFHELSGGEKSIALLSFIFALSKFKTPPFYIFDEVDSALDKVNVERLSNYMLESSDQFLVVSLKHQFFQKCESLFGVYKCPRENKSKVLSYRLK